MLDVALYKYIKYAIIVTTHKVVIYVNPYNEIKNKLNVIEYGNAELLTSGKLWFKE